MTDGSNPDGRGKALTEISLTPGLSRLVEEATDTKYASDFSVRFHMLRRQWSPPPLLEETVAEIKIVLGKIGSRLTPADAGDIATVAFATCMHFWVPDVPQRVEVRIAEDWITDLAGYPIWAIEAAFRDWRRSKSRRPTIAEIRSACEFSVHKLRHLRKVFERCLDARSRKAA